MRFAAAVQTSHCMDAQITIVSADLADLYMQQLERNMNSAASVNCDACSYTTRVVCPHDMSIRICVVGTLKLKKARDF